MEKEGGMGQRGWEGEDQHKANHKAAAAREGLQVPCSFCFQWCNSPECPKAKRVFPTRSNHRDSLEGSLNATTRDKTELGP